MGYTTDYLGHIDIAPSLNEAELGYLDMFSRSRRWSRPGGPYAVPSDPDADEAADSGDRAFNIPPEGQPGLWCDWVPCWDGCCLSFEGSERFYAPVPWLRYLIDHFLKPGATAAAGTDPRFVSFTFDHVLDGMVVGCRRDTKELFAVTVRHNVVRTEVLRRADPRYRAYPPLPYEDAIDDELSPMQRRRRDQAAQGVVLPFTRPGA